MRGLVQKAGTIKKWRLLCFSRSLSQIHIILYLIGCLFNSVAVYLILSKATLQNIVRSINKNLENIVVNLVCKLRIINSSIHLFINGDYNYLLKRSFFSDDTATAIHLRKSQTTKSIRQSYASMQSAMISYVKSVSAS